MSMRCSQDFISPCSRCQRPQSVVKPPQRPMTNPGSALPSSTSPAVRDAGGLRAHLSLSVWNPNFSQCPSLITRPITEQSSRQHCVFHSVYYLLAQFRRGALNNPPAVTEGAHRGTTPRVMLTTWKLLLQAAPVRGKSRASQPQPLPGLRRRETQMMTASATGETNVRAQRCHLGILHCGQLTAPRPFLARSVRHSGGTSRTGTATCRQA